MYTIIKQQGVTRMRMNIIKRFAAGTIGVCFTYALVRMPFNTINNPIETAFMRQYYLS